MRMRLTDMLLSLRLYQPLREAWQQTKRYLPRHVAQRRAEQALYGQFVGRGELCFDIGANVGDKAELLLGLGARVIAVEPQPACVAQIQRRFRQRDDLVVVAEGAGAAVGTQELWICDSASTLTTMSERWKHEGRFATDRRWDRAIQVPITTLDTLIAKYGLPVFCKIDVEGFEQQVLAGLSQPIPALAFEYTREFLEDARHCMERLLEVGPYEFNSTVNLPHLAFADWTTPDALLARLKSRPESGLWGDVYARLRRDS